MSTNFGRITIDAGQMGGVPRILEAYPDLRAEDVAEALRFAAICQ